MLALMLWSFAALAQPAPEAVRAAVAPSFQKVNPAIAHFPTFYRQPIDATHTLLAVGGSVAEPGGGPPDLFWAQPNDAIGLFLADNADPARLRELAIIPSDAGCAVKVERADASAVVMARVTDYGIRLASLKLFFDLRSRRLLKITEFQPVPVPDVAMLDQRLCFVGRQQEERLAACWEGSRPQMAEGALAQQVVQRAASPAARSKYLPIGPQARFFISLDEEKGPRAIEGIAEIAGADHRLYKVPQSSYDEFRRARPERVKDGYTEGSQIEERIGSYQIVDGRLWFGKDFYDGEGMTGVGGIGYFDSPARKFVLFTPPEIVDWSVSSLLVEPDAIWAGLARNPEGARYSGGLLRYDRASGQASRYDVDEVIVKIVRWKDGLYLGTENGLRVFRDGRLARYVFEPSLDGAFQIVAP